MSKLLLTAYACVAVTLVAAQTSQQVIQGAAVETFLRTAPVTTAKDIGWV